MKITNKPIICKRGTICRQSILIPREKMTLREQKIYKSMLLKKPIYFLIMKCIDEEQFLVALVYDKQIKNSKKIHLGKKSFWVIFSEFFVVPKRFMVPDEANQLSNAYETVTSVYDSHARYIKERRKLSEKKKEIDEYWKIVLRESEQNRDEFYRMRAPMEEVTVPEYMVQNAKHPYLGGGVNPR